MDRGSKDRGQTLYKKFPWKNIFGEILFALLGSLPPTSPGQETIKQPPHSCYCDETMEGWVGNGGLKPFIRFWWYFHIFIGFSHLWLECFFGRNWFPVCVCAIEWIYMINKNRQDIDMRATCFTTWLLTNRELGRGRMSECSHHGLQFLHRAVSPAGTIYYNSRRPGLRLLSPFCSWDFKIFWWFISGRSLICLQ